MNQNNINGTVSRRGLFSVVGTIGAGFAVQTVAKAAGVPINNDSQTSPSMESAGLSYNGQVNVYTVKLEYTEQGVESTLLNKGQIEVTQQGGLHGILFGGGTYGPEHIEGAMGFSRNGSYAQINGEVIILTDINTQETLATKGYIDLRDSIAQNIADGLGAPVYEGDLSIVKKGSRVLINTTYHTAKATHLATFETDKDLKNIKVYSMDTLKPGSEMTLYANASREVAALAWQSTVKGMFPAESLEAIVQTDKEVVIEDIWPKLGIEGSVIHARVNGLVGRTNLSTLFTVYTVEGLEAGPTSAPRYQPGVEITPDVTYTASPTPTPQISLTPTQVRTQEPTATPKDNGNRGGGQEKHGAPSDPDAPGKGPKKKTPIPNSWDEHNPGQGKGNGRNK